MKNINDIELDESKMNEGLDTPIVTLTRVQMDKTKPAFKTGETIDIVKDSLILTYPTLAKAGLTSFKVSSNMTMYLKGLKLAKNSMVKERVIIVINFLKNKICFTGQAIFESSSIQFGSDATSTWSFMMQPGKGWVVEVDESLELTDKTIDKKSKHHFGRKKEDV